MGKKYWGGFKQQKAIERDKKVNKKKYGGKKGEGIAKNKMRGEMKKSDAKQWRQSTTKIKKSFPVKVSLGFRNGFAALAVVFFVD